MPYYLSVDFRDERYRQGLGRAQRRNDELLSVPADFQCLERGDGHLAYCAHIGFGFASNNDLQIHSLISGFSMAVPNVNGPMRIINFFHLQLC